MASGQAAVAAAGTLPTELLCLIFSFLDGPPPSDDRLHEQPRRDMLRASRCLLKNVSRVSKRWRAVVLPTLFRHVVWSLDWLELQDPDLVDELPLLAFLRTSGLGRHVQSFAIIVSHTTLPSKQRSETPGSSSASSSARRFAVSGAAWTPPGILDPSFAIYNEDYNWLWNALFKLVDPLRFTIIASPQTLARLFASALFIGDADLFASEEQFHILSLSRESRSTPAPPPPTQPPNVPAAAPNSGCGGARRPAERQHIPVALFTLRPWSHLLLNENSSIRAYRNYEYFAKNPPSILDPLLISSGDGGLTTSNSPCLLPPTVRSLAYVAIFPLALHFRKLTRHLPRLDRLFVQLAPRNDILRDPAEMDHVQPADLWLERQECYESILFRLAHAPPAAPPHGGQLPLQPPSGALDDGGDDSDDFNILREARNWSLLRRLETGDAHDDADWWLWMVQQMLAGRRDWRVEREGVFVRT
jgi:hypothetical protein